MNRKKDRVTIRDVSAAVGVSIATVNRALNGKPRVSEETRKKILKTAEEMGFRANRAAQALSRNTIKIGVIIQRAIDAFNKEFVAGAEEAFAELQDFNVSGEIITVDEQFGSTHEQFLTHMRSLKQQGYQGIVLLPNSDTTGYGELIDQLYSEGTYVATAVTDLPECKRLLSVRGNGYMAGQLAAEMLDKFNAGKELAVFTSSDRVNISLENVSGFLKEAEKRGLCVVPKYETHNIPQLARESVEHLIKHYPNVKGIYIATANSVAVCERICELGLENQYQLITTDLFEEMRPYLDSGLIAATLFQNPKKQASTVIHELVSHIDSNNMQPKEMFITPKVVLQSNCKEF